MMAAMRSVEESAAEGARAAQVQKEPRKMEGFEGLERMSLQELLYYVLAGDGRRRPGVKTPVDLMPATAG